MREENDTRGGKGRKGKRLGGESDERGGKDNANIIKRRQTPSSNN